MTARYETIASWVRKNGWTRGVELGVFDGRTHMYLIENCPDLMLWGVDLWGEAAAIEGQTKSGEKCFCRYCSETRNARRARRLEDMERDVFEWAKHHPRSVVIKGHTAEVADLVPDGMDFVFVDGDHSTEGVTADIAAWRKKIRSGGRMIGHDYNMRSVRDAVLRSFDPSAVRTADDHLWWVEC